ncbi:hypothetical protein FWG95_00285 [Candidatus Saccharibacteria bacterium]|nr:hypothetical protein [Candidatus Saccharibacteria bacterium]
MNGWKNHFHDKASLLRDRRWLKRLGQIKTWQLLIILLLFVMLTAIFLRLNNLGMIEKRAELIAADETGDINKVTTAAKNLQNFVANHMNTYTGRVALQTLYDQAAAAALEANRPPEIDAGAYQRASEECRPQLTSFGYRAWANCVAARVGTSEITDLDQNNVPPPDPDAYYIEYAPARWSPDLAGISLLISFLLVFVIVLRLVLLLILKLILKFKYRAA